MPVIYLIQATDAPQHSGKMQDLLEELKSERRISSYQVYDSTADLSPLGTSVKGVDMVISMLTNGMEPDKSRVESALSQLKEDGAKVAEIIVDHVTYEKEFITFPGDLKPIRDREDMDAAWDRIGQQLREIYPPQEVELEETPIDWLKYLKYAAAVILIGLITWWLLGRTGSTPEATFSYGVFDVESGNITETNQCYAPCVVIFNNKTKEADRILWSFGDDSTSTSDTPSHLYIDAGDYNIRLTAYKGSNEYTHEEKLLVKARPEAEFEMSGFGCFAPCQVSFENRSQGATMFEWEFGDNTEGSTVKAPIHNYQKAGSYKVVLTVKNEDGLQDVMGREITIRDEPYPLAQFDYRISYQKPRRNPTSSNFTTINYMLYLNNALPATVSFENNSEDADSYEWDFGDNTPINTNKSPRHVYKEYGTYNVRLTAKDGNKANTITRSVVIRQKKHNWTNTSAVLKLQKFDNKEAAKQLITD